MEVPALKPFDKSDWNAIAAAFQNAPSLPLGQAWLDKTEEKFRPGTTRLGWMEDALCVFAHLSDDKIFTLAAKDNDPLWKLGDVFELFLRDKSRENYIEFHIAPTGHRLQLCFPSDQSIHQVRDGHLELEDLMHDSPLFNFQVRAVDDGWEVFAEVPFSTLGSSERTLKGATILGSFSRYDYSDETSDPVLSSTSEHTKLNYHRQQEWKELTFR